MLIPQELQLSRCSSVDAENMRLPLSVAFWRNGQPVSAGFGKYGDANTVG